MNELHAILDDLVEEIARARIKFPTRDMRFAAVAEEFSEVCRAICDGESRERLRAECVQLACTALRLAMEGDSAYPITLPPP